MAKKRAGSGISEMTSKQGIGDDISKSMQAATSSDKGGTVAYGGKSMKSAT